MLTHAKYFASSELRNAFREAKSLCCHTTLPPTAKWGATGAWNNQKNSSIAKHNQTHVRHKIFIKKCREIIASNLSQLPRHPFAVISAPTRRQQSFTLHKNVTLRLVVKKVPLYLHGEDAEDEREKKFLISARLNFLYFRSGATNLMVLWVEGRRETTSTAFS